VKWHLKHEVHGTKPWAVQAEAMRRSRGHQRYGYWLEQGLGKTPLTLNDYVSLDDNELLVVIAPQSFKADWVFAPAEWGLGFLRSGMWPDEPMPHDWEQGVYSINYEAVSRSKAARQLLKLVEARRVLLAVDESKALSNPNSGFTKSVLEVAKRAHTVRLLNGTPATQSPLDLYGQLRALGQLDGVNSFAFRNRYAVLGGFMGKQLLPDFKNGEELARLMDSCSFRALKRDWRKDLPERNYSTIHLEITDKQRRHYQTMLDEFYVLVEDAGLTANMVITQMIKLQQITSGFVLIDGRALPIEDPAKVPKVQTVKQLCGGAGKTIVVHHYKASGQMLIDQLTREGLNPAFIQGGMQPYEVIEQKRRFNDESDCRVLVGQERAASRGHTLLGQPGNDRCNRIVFFENEFSLYYRSQVEDRNHRGEQDQMCTIYDLVSSPVEARAIEILVAKKEMVEALDQVVAVVRSMRDKAWGRSRSVLR